jgi:predicted nucleotidyltransferase
MQNIEFRLKDDYKDMIKILLEENVKFILVGGIAVILYGHVRGTKDLDLWVYANSQNAPLLIKALAKFGAPMQNISASDFELEGTVFQIGTEPIRIDIITRIAGLNFEEAMNNVNIMEIDGLQVPVISIEDLIKNKKASGRFQDLADAKVLEKILEKRSR